MCIPFNITTSVIGTATLKFTWACDDMLGDPAGGPNPEGVYVNQHGCGIKGGTFSTSTPATKTITTFVHPGANQLFVHLRDTQGTNSGVIFSAVITVCPPGNGQLDVVVRSGNVNGTPLSADQTTAAWCQVGHEFNELKLKFDKCKLPSYVDGTNTWSNPPGTFPPGVDPLSRWIYWKDKDGDRRASSALVRTPFYIPWAVTSSTMIFSGAADDQLGDPADGKHHEGVFLDETNQSITSTTWTTLTTANQTVSAGQGWHNLYIYARDLHDRWAGTVFSATFHVFGGKPCSSINDPDDPGNPAPISVYPAGPNELNVVFDRDISLESVQSLSNYQADQGGVIVAAMLGRDGRSALLTIADEAGWGTHEHVTVSGIVAADTMLVMPQAQSLPFYSGILTAQVLQAPDPAALAMCVDRSRFAGFDSLPGDPVTIIGTCAGRALECYSLMDSASTSRGGLLISGSPVVMELGMKYQVTGRVMESEGETVLMDVMDVVELSQSAPPRPIARPISVVRRAICDSGQNQETGEDFEGMLVQVSVVQVVRGLGKGTLSIKPVSGAETDTITVCGVDSTFSYVPRIGDKLAIIGLLVFRDGRFQIAPRDGDDFVPRRVSTPPTLRPTVYPNPANPSVTISFQMRQSASVQINIYDIRGGLIHRLADRTYSVGRHEIVWKGDDENGAVVSSGMYFYRLVSRGMSEEGKIMILK
jgi:hypothetical protein